MRRYGILKQEDYRTTEWSGGKTTQLAIWPEGAVYGDRNFGWRVSSATVETPESDFTPLPDYDRHLMMLKGDILIRHNGGEWKSLPEGTPYFFDGADHTESRGEAVDFNLMLRKGQFEGAMESVAGDAEHVKSALARLAAQYETVLLYCVSGEMAVSGKAEDGAAHTCELKAGETLVLTGPLPEYCAFCIKEGSFRGAAAAINTKKS